MVAAQHRWDSPDETSVHCVLQVAVERGQGLSEVRCKESKSPLAEAMRSFLLARRAADGSLSTWALVYMAVRRPCPFNAGVCLPPLLSHHHPELLGLSDI